MKSAQTGISERLLAEAVWLADSFPENSIFLQPNAAQLADFVRERVNPALSNSPYFQSVMEANKKSADNVFLKKLSKGFIFFRGCNSATQITGIAGDCLFADELDLMSQENIPYFFKRLQHSNRKWIRWASTPSLPDFGIHKKFLETDQKEYQIKCAHCGEWQVLNFDENIDVERELLVCKKCRKQIIPWQCSGEWIKKNPSADKSGYHVSGLYAPTLSVSALIEESKKSAQYEVQQFYNQTLGVPYMPAGAILDDLVIRACVRDFYIPQHSEFCFMGVDVGKKLHVIIRGEDRILFIGTVSNFFGKDDSLEDLIKKWNPQKVVIDALPETHEIAKIQKTFSGKIFSCYYSGMAEVIGDEFFKISESKINCNRVALLDNVFDEFRNQKIEVPKNIDDYAEFKKQVKSTVRLVTKNSATGNAKVEYKELSDDHFLHACGYSLLAKKIDEKIVEVECFNIRRGDND